MQELLTLKEYSDIAHKIVASLTNKGMSKYILNNDELMGNIITSIAKADSKWDIAKGSSIYGYRKMYAIFTIKNHFNDLYKQPKTISLEKISENGFQVEEKRRADECTHEYANMLLNSECLTDKQRRVLQAYYIDNKNMREIAKELNCSHQNIAIILNRAITNLQTYVKRP